MTKSGTLTKAHIIDAVAESNGYTRKKSKYCWSLSKKSLEFGDDVLISGFGKFCVRNKGERQGRNPATGKDMVLRSRKVVTFRSSKKLREKVNGKKISQL